MAPPSQTLPSDITFEILTRTSYDTVGRSRLVSKQLNNMSYDSIFVDSLCKRTKTTSGVFIQSLEHNEYISTFVPAVDNNNDISDSQQVSLSFLPPGPTKIEAAHQGILLCENNSNWKIPQYYVCKPTTKEWEKIPNPKTRYFTVKTCLMVLRSNPIWYKIVRFSRAEPSSSDRFYYNLRCEVSDSKTQASKPWKQLKNISFSYGSWLLSHTPAVLACGTVHCLTSDDLVFCFHVAKETWETFKLPPCLRDFQQHEYCHVTHQLAEYQGRLAWIIEAEIDMMELWVMEDHKNKAWNRKLTITTKGLENICTSFGALCNNDVALMTGYGRIGFYKFADSSCKVAHVNKIYRPTEMFMLQSDLWPTNMKGPWKSCKGN